MQLQNNHQFSTYTALHLLILLIAITFSGCAQKPWTTTLGEKEYAAGMQLVDKIANQNAQCVDGFQSDITLEYANPLQKRTLSGFLQYSPDMNYKFVTTNPLGQPIVIITGNQRYYQMINTLEAKFVSGGMTSFALRNKLPIHFLKGRWSDWLTGKNSIPSEFVTDISHDEQLRGIWVTFEDNKGARNISHLLIDPNSEIILERILETRQKKPLATIQYGNYFQNQLCYQPQQINIAGLEYGTTISLQLSDIEFTSEIKTYELSPPQGYLRQFRP